MKKLWVSKAFLSMIIALGMASCSYAGSERLIMAMTTQRMDQENLVHVQFLSPEGISLESSTLKQMLIRERDCNTGHVFEMVKDYKIGYAPKNMLVGIYLYPRVWSNKTLCFNVPNLGKIEQGLDTATNNGRFFQLKVAP